MVEPKFVSVGKTIRDVTSYLLNYYTITMKSLSTQPSLESKKEDLKSLCKTYNDYLRKSIIFVQNCQKIDKITNIKIKTGDLNWYRNKIINIINQFYDIMIICKAYRTPSFNLQPAIDTINMTSHPYLKSSIYEVISNNINSTYSNCSKEKQLEFIQKYEYNQNLNSKFNFKNLLKDIKIILNIQTQIMKIKDKNNNLEISFNDNLFDFTFKDIISYKLCPYRYFIPNTENNNNILFTYYFQEIIPYKENATFTKKKYSDLLFNNIYKINFEENPFEINPNENYNIDLGLEKLKDLLCTFTQENVYPLMFDYFENKIKKYCDKFDFPIEVCKISVDDKMDIEEHKNGSNKNEKIIIEFKFDHNILPEDLKNNFKIYISSMYEIGKIKVNSSFSIVCDEPYNPFIYIENEENIYNINYFPFKKIINNYYEQYRKIVLNSLFEKMSNIPSLIIPFEFSPNDDGIDLFISIEKECPILLFSIFLNSQGKIDIIDYDFFFSIDSIVSVNDIINNYIINDNIDIFEFNRIITSHFIQKNFSFLNMKILINSINFNEKVLEIKISIPKYKFDSCDVNIILKLKYENNYSFNVQSFKFLFINIKQISEFEFIKYLKLKSKSYHFSPQSLKIFFNDIIKMLMEHDELIKNILELTSFYELKDKNIIHEEKGKIIITLKGNNLSTLFQKFIDKIEISSKNIIFRIYLKKQELENLFVQRKFKNYSYLENETLISFDKNKFTLSYFILSKLKASEWNSTKKVLSENLPKNIEFIENIGKIIINKDNYEYFKDSSNYYISPICLYFKYKTKRKERNVYIQFKLSKNWNISIHPIETHFDSFDSDLKKIVEESKPSHLLNQIKYYCFINSIFEILTEYFSSYWLINIKIPEKEDFKGKIIVLCKDYNTFEIYAKDNFSLYIEVYSSHTILIYSNLFLNKNKNFFNILEEKFKALQNNKNETIISFKEPDDTDDTENQYKKIITIDSVFEELIYEKIKELCNFLIKYLNPNNQ